MSLITRTILSGFSVLLKSYIMYIIYIKEKNRKDNILLKVVCIYQDTNENTCTYLDSMNIGWYLLGEYLQKWYLLGQYLLGQYLLGEYLVGQYLLGEYLVGQYLLGEFLQEWYLYIRRVSTISTFLVDFFKYLPGYYSSLIFV